MEEHPRSRLRLLAPAALVFFVLAFLFVVTSTNVEDKTASSSARQAEERDLGDADTGTTPRRRGREQRLPDDVYVVEAGDTLGGIAEQVGVTVERLMELNPDLDPQALVSGQKIKLRE